MDVPPKLSRPHRVFATGQGRKTDATDAHPVAAIENALKKVVKCSERTEFTALQLRL